MKLDRPATRISGREGDIYFVVALTELSAATGMFALHGVQGESPSAEKEHVPNLEVGDAVIWTRENRGRNATGADGVMQIIMYR